MKKGILILCSLLLVMSCTSPLASRFEKHVQKVESNFENMSEKDWESSKATYDALIKEFNENIDSYTQEEIATINNAIAKYKGLLVKKGMRNIDAKLKGATEQGSAFLDGLGGKKDKKNN